MEIESLEDYESCDGDTINIYSSDDQVDSIEGENDIASGYVHAPSGQLIPVSNCCHFDCYNITESLTIEIISVFCGDADHWETIESYRYWILKKINAMDIKIKYEGGNKQIIRGTEMAHAIRLMNFSFTYQINLRREEE